MRIWPFVVIVFIIAIIAAVPILSWVADQNPMCILADDPVLCAVVDGNNE